MHTSFRKERSQGLRDAPGLGDLELHTVFHVSNCSVIGCIITPTASPSYSIAIIACYSLLSSLIFRTLSLLYFWDLILGLMGSLDCVIS